MVAASFVACNPSWRSNHRAVVELGGRVVGLQREAVHLAWREGVKVLKPWELAKRAEELNPIVKRRAAEKLSRQIAEQAYWDKLPQAEKEKIARRNSEAG